MAGFVRETSVQVALLIDLRDVLEIIVVPLRVILVVKTDRLPREIKDDGSGEASVGQRQGILDDAVQC